LTAPLPINVPEPSRLRLLATAIIGLIITRRLT
jgi:hypothetical protein